MACESSGYPSYIFPSSKTDRIVLEAALGANPNDATAQYLLGTLLFSKESVDAAMTHWDEARRLDPHRPVLDADIGNALLRMKNDPQGALAAFREGAHSDPNNPEIYAGLDGAMSVLGMPAAERAAALSQYPIANSTQLKMPVDLVYQLALTRAEAKQFGPALALFKGRFLASAEGGISSDEVQFEIERMQAKAWADEGNCAAAEGFLESKPTEKGLEDRTARDYVKLAEIARTCGRTQEANGFLEKAVAYKDSENLVWGIQADEMLGRVSSEEAHKRLARALAAAGQGVGSDVSSSSEIATSPGEWCYSAGLLNLAHGDKAMAKRLLTRSLALPDSHMSHHLARMALASMVTGK
ncbi:MAG: hypothetical protein ACP5E2_15575 [Terracidiphilus sp.]